MLADIANYLHGDVIRSENVASRNRDLLADNESLRILRRQVNDEQASLANDFNQDEATIEHRKALSQKMVHLTVEGKEYLDRLIRFTRLQEDLANLRFANVVVNGLAWDIGYPTDGSDSSASFSMGCCSRREAGCELSAPPTGFSWPATREANRGTVRSPIPTATGSSSSPNRPCHYPSIAGRAS